MKKECKHIENVYLNLTDELNTKEKERFVQHLEACSFCKEEYDLIKGLQSELNCVEDVELPAGYRESLHEKLVKSKETARINESGNKYKIYYRFISAAAAVVLFAVMVKGFGLYGSMFNKGASISQTAANSLESLTGSVNTVGDMSYNKNLKAEDSQIMMESKAKSMEDGKEKSSLMDRVRNGEILGMGEAGITRADQQEVNPDIASDKSAKFSAPDVNSSAQGSTAKVPVNDDNRIMLVPPVSDSTIKADKSQVNLEFETIKKDSMSRKIERENLVIKNQEQWKECWNTNVTEQGPAPEVDFNQYTVIAVFYGTKSNGGYSIEINNMVENEKSVEVYVKETVPEIGTAQIEVITSPYHIAKVKNTEKEIVFKKIE